MKPFLTLNSSFNLKNEHSNNVEFRWLIPSPSLSLFHTFFHIDGLMDIDLLPYWFWVRLLFVSRLQSNDAGVPDLLFQDFLELFSFQVFFFSFSIRLTDPISGNAVEAKRNQKQKNKKKKEKKRKGGWPYQKRGQFSHEYHTHVNKTKMAFRCHKEMCGI